jgi:hypothetical protein
MGRHPQGGTLNRRDFAAFGGKNGQGILGGKRMPFHGLIRGVAFLLGGLVLFGTVGSALRAETARVLTEEEFRRIGEQGFGDPGNSYPWGMVWFQGRLYVGTNHNFLCLTRSIRDTGEAGINPEIPDDCDPDFYANDFRGRIYAYDPVTGVIELVYISPMINVLTSDGTRADVPMDLGYRTMIVFTEPDGTEAIYTGSFISSELPGVPPRILRSTDGRRFEPLGGSLAANTTYTSYRSLTAFKSRLYVLAIGRTLDRTALLESSDPASGVFREVSPPFFGDPVNVGAFELEVFKGYLYVGTATASDGFQLLKTQASGEPPYVFQKVLVQGAYRGSANQNVVSLCPFKDHLYIGTGINFVGLDYFPDVNPAPAELLRVDAGGHWDIVCGDDRNTPVGHKKSISGMNAGCGNFFSGYIWRMAEHDGILYMSTFDLSAFTQFFENVTFEQVQNAGIFDRYPNLVPLVENRDIDEIGDIIAAIEGGFDLWGTPDGTNWTRVSRTGFGDWYSYGVRNFVSTPFGLFVGAANPFFGFKLFLGQPEGFDYDGDGAADDVDNCPHTWNLGQYDSDADGRGDACAVSGLPPNVDGASGEPDSDGDGVPDHFDNCPNVRNESQADADNDGVGDACEVNGGPGPEPEPEPGQSAGRPCGVGAHFLVLILPLLLFARCVHRPSVPCRRA